MVMELLYLEVSILQLVVELLNDEVLR